MTALGTLHPAFERAGYTAPQGLPPVVLNDPSLPLVSIVTPSYNQGKFICETIQSVLSQDYPNIEYWIIDGESTDETMSVLKEYEHDPRFHWISEKDRGQSDAINKGLARCRGEIFSWLCSDDLLMPGALRSVAAAWTTHTHPCAVYGWAREIDQDGDSLGYCPGQSSKMTLADIVRFKSLPIQPATFVPTEPVRAIGGVDPSLSFAMDLDLWIKLISNLPFHHIPRVLALYRLHPKSKTVSLTPRFIDEVYLIFDRAAERNILTKRQAKSYPHLFAAVVYLTKENWNLLFAFADLAKAITADPAVAPYAVFIFVRGLARAAWGESHWSKLRWARMRLR